MTTARTYVAITTLTMNPCSRTKESRANTDGTWRCTGCAAPKPDVQSINVHLQATPRDKPLNFVYGCAVTVVYKPFLIKFPQQLVERDLYLGNDYGPKGKLIPDWVTVHGRRRLIIRGTKEAGTRRCTDCGRDVYSSQGESYLYPQPPNDVVIFERAGGGGLIVPEELFNALDIGTWRRLHIERLQVLDPPPDGLGELPNA